MHPKSVFPILQNRLKTGFRLNRKPVLLFSKKPVLQKTGFKIFIETGFVETPVLLHAKTGFRFLMGQSGKSFFIGAGSLVLTVRGLIKTNFSFLSL